MGRDIPDAFWRRREPFILAFWHGQMMLMVHSWQTDMTMRMLISRNFDGEVIARTVSSFGIRAVRGSSDKNGKDKGGRAAMRAMLGALKDGDCVGFTPDGPKGPRMRAKEGIAAIARLSGAPIIPVVAATSRTRHAGSWDRFAVALPFARAIIMWGDPVQVPKGADGDALDAARDEVETALNALSREACDRVGARHVEPASATAGAA